MMNKLPDFPNGIICERTPDELKCSVCGCVLDSTHTTVIYDPTINGFLCNTHGYYRMINDKSCCASGPSIIVGYEYVYTTTCKLCGKVVVSTKDDYWRKFNHMCSHCYKEQEKVERIMEPVKKYLRGLHIMDRYLYELEHIIENCNCVRCAHSVDMLDATIENQEDGDEYESFCILCGFLNKVVDVGCNMMDCKSYKPVEGYNGEDN